MLTIPSPGRRRVAALVYLVLLLSAAAVCSQEASPPKADDDTLALFVKMRAGEWDGKSVLHALDALLASGDLAACGWWLDEAERAGDEGKLADSARRELRARRSKYLSAMRSRFPDAIKLGRDMAKHALKKVGRDGDEESREFIAAASLHLGLFPDVSARRSLERAAKRCTGKREEPPPSRALTRLRGQTESHTKAAKIMRWSRRKAIISQFERFGTRRAYRIARGLAVSEPIDERREKLLGRVRTAGLSCMKTTSLKIWVAGDFPIEAYLAGKKIRSQRGAHYPLDQATREWRPIVARVLPGDWVVIKVMLVKGLPNLYIADGRHIFVSAEHAGEALPPTSFHAMRPPDPWVAHVVALEPVRVGVLNRFEGMIFFVPQAGDEPKEEETGHDLETEIRRKYGDAISSRSKSIEAWFAKSGREFTAIKGPEQAAYVVRVPDLDYPWEKGNPSAMRRD